MFFDDHLDGDDEQTPVTPSARGSERLAAPTPLTAEGGGSDRALMVALIGVTETERGAPEILPHPTDLIERCVRRLAEQQARVDALAAEEREAAARAPQASLLPFRPSDIMSIELQRMRFYLTELLRRRVRKIEALAAALRYEALCEDDATLPRLPHPQRAHLSPNERVVADRLADLAQRAATASGLHAAPEPLQLLIPNPPHAEGLEILPAPQMATYVFGLALEDVGVVQFGQDIEQEIHAGELFLAPYMFLRPYVIEGKIRLV